MHVLLRFGMIACWVAGTLTAEISQSPSSGRVKSLKITILSTMLADRYVGEWGFAALVEADGHRILFDTGAHSDVVRRNVDSMQIDLTTVPEIVLSHSHSDHTGGFMALRNSVVRKTPSALARAHVGQGIFIPRVITGTGLPDNPALLLKPEYESTGGAFVVHAEPVEIHPGVWLTGPVPRQHPERNWSSGLQLVTPAGRTEDNLPEDMSLICDTDAGLVILTGCGHAGVINIVDYARHTVRPARIHALIGGLHLFSATEQTLSWTAEKLREAGVDYFLGGHCTGIETVYRLRGDLRLDRARAVVASVGSSFELGRGIDPGLIAK
jgi:7,8-dihydropterin-6-yl-methyl-4-(beta-D-ribofuranosyl)aminobenzene 5'-phosphate synthase